MDKSMDKQEIVKMDVIMVKIAKVKENVEKTIKIKSTFDVILDW